MLHVPFHDPRHARRPCGRQNQPSDVVRFVLWLMVVVAGSVEWRFEYSRRLIERREAAGLRHETLREFRGQIDAMKEDYEARIAISDGLDQRTSPLTIPR